MRKRIGLSLVWLFSCGLAFMLGRHVFNPSASKHWAVVRKHFEDQLEYDKRIPVADSFWALSKSVEDIRPELSSLVREGDLSFADIVLPNVPISAETINCWRTYCNTNLDIIYAIGNPQYVAFKPSG